MKIYIDEILKVTNGKLFGNKDTSNTYICGAVVDSREVKPGYLFIPNKTEKFDGEDYINQAFENGAIATFISKGIENIDNSKYYIKVENIKEAFHTLARYNRSKYKIPVIGITGSVGKTTAKEMIATVLEEKYKVMKTEGNLNSELGLPIMVMSLEEEHELAVFEMGTDHLGEMELLESIAKPTDAVIMNIGVSHLEKFGTRENIFADKSQIYSHIQNKENILLNTDNDILQKYADTATMYGMENTEADIIAKDVRIEDGFLLADVWYKDNKIGIKVPGLSIHLIYPALASIYFGIKYGLTNDQIKQGLLKYKTLKMRMDIQKLKNGITVIDDTYNANPQSMKAAIDVLDKTNAKIKIAILGDMFELGDNEKQMHEDVGIYLNGKTIDKVVAIGDNIQYMYNALDKTKIKAYYYSFKEDFYEHIQEVIDNTESTTILLKASRGMHLEELIKEIESV